MMYRMRHRSALTVLGLHRVLPESDPRRSGAMDSFTIEPGHFEELLSFLTAHYTVIGMGDVLDSLEWRRPLPGRALLITFDDGWADTYEYAAPALRARGLPAVVFVVGDRIGQRHAFWETEWHARLSRMKEEDSQRVWRHFENARAMPASLDERSDVLAQRLREYSLTDRWRWLDELAGGPVDFGKPQMMDDLQIRELSSTGFAVCGHGFTHEWFTRVADVTTEIDAYRRRLRELLGPALADERFLDVLSFPHGRYTEAILERLRAAGIRAFFTSDTCTNRLERGIPQSDVFGRLWLGPGSLSEGGRFAPDLVASRCFRASATSLGGQPSASYR